MREKLIARQGAIFFTVDVMLRVCIPWRYCNLIVVEKDSSARPRAMCGLMRSL